jgi:hypothetical protein
MIQIFAGGTCEVKEDEDDDEEGSTRNVLTGGHTLLPVNE